MSSGAVDVPVCCCFIEGLGFVPKSSVNFVMGSWHPCKIDVYNIPF